MGEDKDKSEKQRRQAEKRWENKSVKDVLFRWGFEKGDQRASDLWAMLSKEEKTKV